VVKECSKPGEVSGMVEGIRAETGRALPLLRDEWQFVGIEEVLS